MKAFWKKVIVYAAILTAVALITTAPAAFAGRGGGHGRKPDHSRVGNHHIGNNFRHYDQNVISSDGVNQRCYRYDFGTVVSADLDRNCVFNGGFCISSDLQDGNGTLIISVDQIPYDEVWLRHNNNGCFYPVDVATGATSIEVADGGWADLDMSVNNTVEAAVLFSSQSTSAEDNADTSADSESSGGGCNAADLSFGIIALCVPLFFRRR